MMIVSERLEFIRPRTTFDCSKQLISFTIFPGYRIFHRLLQHCYFWYRKRQDFFGWKWNTAFSSNGVQLGTSSATHYGYLQRSWIPNIIADRSLYESGESDWKWFNTDSSRCDCNGSISNNEIKKIHSKQKERYKSSRRLQWYQMDAINSNVIEMHFHCSLFFFAWNSSPERLDLFLLISMKKKDEKYGNSLSFCEKRQSLSWDALNDFFRIGWLFSLFKSIFNLL